MKTPNYVFDDELYHHGIQGQKWGERRFQNEDGSWTPEGRERYGKGNGDRSRAKDFYKLKKYKSDLKSKEQIKKDKRASKEERNRIKEYAKTERLKAKEQAKTIKLQNKEQAKIDEQKNNLRNTKNMSGDELKQAIERLNLEIEYNKKAVIAKNPNSALAKADQFFESTTGKIAAQIAVNTLPTLIQQGANKILDSKLNSEKAKLDIAKTKLDIVKTQVDIDKTIHDMNKGPSAKDNAETALKEAQARKWNADAMEKELTNKANKANNSDIGKTVAPGISNIGKTVAPGNSNIGKTVAPGNSNIGKTVAPIAQKAVNSLTSVASNEIKKHSETIASEAKRGVREGVNEAVKDLLGNSSGPSPKSLPTYSQDELFRILKGMGRI